MNFLLFFMFYLCFGAALGASSLVKNQSFSDGNSTWFEKVKSKMGISYMSFFNGPGILGDDLSVSPNAIGKPSDDGLVLMNNVSFKYKMTRQVDFDFMTRFHYVMNNGNDVQDFKPFRWQSPRVGVSTIFFATRNSKLQGAFNTDLPYSMPQPIGGGYIAQQRTTLATPGLFAKYTYAPSSSRWSIFSLVQPRFYIYKDRSAAEPQLSRAGFSPKLKNEFTLSFSPSLNYAFSDQLGARMGTQVIYKKLIASDWNPFNSTVRSADPLSKAWRLNPMPLQLGLTYVFGKLLKLSGYIQGYPIGAQRFDKKGNKASFEDTVSAGAWISGVLL